MTKVDILIPTRNRPSTLAVTLTGLAFQEYSDFAVIIADQSDQPIEGDPSLKTLIRLLKKHGHDVRVLRDSPRRGMAQQRQFLLEQATAPFVLYVDDDVLLEPFALGLMVDALRSEGVGFVGQPLIGLSYADDPRPDEQVIELWKSPVRPETVTPESDAWQRYKLHNAANVLHVQEKLGASLKHPIKYKIAWVGGCVLFDAQKLREAGGFEFWKDVPEEHAGEDVYAQLRVMKRFGGFGILPSGAYHQEAPTTIPNRKYDIPKELPL